MWLVKLNLSARLVILLCRASTLKRLLTLHFCDKNLCFALLLRLRGVVPGMPSLELVVHPAYDSPRWRACPLTVYETFSGGRLRRPLSLNCISDDVLGLIFHKLVGHRTSAQDLLSLGSCCKRLRKLAQAPQLWQANCVAHYAAPKHLDSSVQGFPGWLALYRCDSAPLTQYCLLTQCHTKMALSLQFQRGSIQKSGCTQRCGGSTFCISRQPHYCGLATARRDSSLPFWLWPLSCCPSFP